MSICRINGSELCLGRLAFADLTNLVRTHVPQSSGGPRHDLAFANGFGKVVRRGLHGESTLGLAKRLLLLVETESARDSPREELVIELQTQVKVIGGSACEGSLAHSAVCSAPLAGRRLTVVLNDEKVALASNRSRPFSLKSRLQSSSDSPQGGEPAKNGLDVFAMMSGAGEPTDNERVERSRNVHLLFGLRRRLGTLRDPFGLVRRHLRARPLRRWRGSDELSGTG